jgi:TolB protein
LILRRSQLALVLLAFCAGLLALAPVAGAADRGVIAFQAFRGGERLIGTVPAEGGPVKWLGSGLQPSISANGQKIAFVRNTKTGLEIFVMDADGDNVRQVTSDEDVTNTEPGISPDGKRIAYVGDRDGMADARSKIFVVDADGSDQRQLTSGTKLDYEPSFSPDGKRIAFIRGPGFTVLMTMNDKGGDVTALTQPQGPFTTPRAPSYSPDGKRIVFQAFAKGNRIFAVDAADGGDRVQLTGGDSQGLEPAYSPNGASIVFRRGDDLFTMDDDGSGVEQLPASDKPGTAYIRPSWGR